jgi:hypothetical protein
MSLASIIVMLQWSWPSRWQLDFNCHILMTQVFFSFLPSKLKSNCHKTMTGVDLVPIPINISIPFRYTLVLVMTNYNSKKILNLKFKKWSLNHQNGHWTWLSHLNIFFNHPLIQCCCCCFVCVYVCVCVCFFSISLKLETNSHKIATMVNLILVPMDTSMPPKVNISSCDDQIWIVK